MNILIVDGSRLSGKLFAGIAAMIGPANIKVGRVKPLEFIQKEPKLHCSLRSKGPRDKWGKLK